MCLAEPCDIQKHAGLDAVLSEVLLVSFVTYQFMIRGVHEFDPFYPLLPATDNDLSILWDGDCFLELSSSAVQVRRVNVINSVTGFDEAVETFRYISSPHIYEGRSMLFTVICHCADTLLD